MATILQLTPLYAPFLGGVEENIRAFMEYSRHKHIVLTDLLPGTKPLEIAGRNRIVRVGPSRTAASNAARIPDLWLDCVREIRKATLLKKQRYDILHLRACQVTPRIFPQFDQRLGRSFAKYLGLWRLSGKPIVVTFHTMPSHDFPETTEYLSEPFPSEKVRRSWLGYERTVANHASAIFCVDKYMVDSLRRILPDVRPTWTPSGIDTQGLLRAAASTKKPWVTEILARLDRFRTIIVFIGRVEIEKGLAYLYRLSRAINDTEAVVVVGDGRESSLPSRSNILVLGSQPLHVVAPVLKRATCVFNPVLFNGVGRVSWETLTLGVPLVMLERGHDRRPLTNGNHAIFVRSAKDALQQIRNIAQDERLREEISRQGKLIAAQSDLRVIAPKLDQAYTALENL